MTKPLSSKLISYIFLSLIIISLFVFWQQFPSFADPDTYYHAKTSELIAAQGVLLDFPWQQYTVFKTHYIDHHFLFHLLTIPFLSFTTPFWAQKIIGIISALIFFLIFYTILKKYKIRFALLYPLILLFTGPFMARLNLMKTSAISLCFLFAGLYLFLKKKNYLLFILAFAYVWLYNGWPLLLILIIIYTLLNLKTIKHYYRSLISCFGGSLAGIIINPYFPTNLTFYKHHIFNIGLVNYKKQFSVGLEWYGYPLKEFITQDNLLFILILLGCVTLLLSFLKKQKIDRTIIFLAVTSAIFFMLTLRAARFLEYFIPFVTLFSALILNQYLKNNPQCFKEITKIWKKKNWKIILFCSYLIITASISMGKAIYYNFLLLTPEKTITNTQYQPAMQWLINNTPEKSIVFNTDWDDWPMLYYHNLHNYFIVGLDPTFMYDHDPELYQLWEDIGNGQIKKDLATTIKNNFNSEYIFINKKERRKLLLARLQRNSEFTQVYAGPDSYIFKIK